MNRIPAAPLLAIMMLLLSGMVSAAEVYVATTGRDTNPGTFEEPFATLERARDEVRTLKKVLAPEGGIVVHVRGGDYSLPQMLVLGPEDSGTAAAPVVYRAYGEERVVLTGGRPITGFTPHTDAVLKATLNALDFAGRPFRLLVFDGKRQEMARYPNRNVNDLNGGDWAYVAGQRYDMYSDTPDESGYHEQNRHLDFWQRNVPRLTRSLEMKPEDARGWTHPEQGEVSVFPRFNWWHYLLPISGHDPESRTLQLGKDSFYEIRPGDRYFIRGLLEELDHPGEWHLDRETWTLYFWPPTPLDGKPVYAPALERILDMQGCAHIRFEGFIFECSEGTAVSMKACENCTVTRCIIRNAGGYDGNGVTIEEGRNNTVRGCDIYDIGCHGVYMSGGDKFTLAPGNNSVENCVIHHVGLEGRHGKGVELTGSGNRIARNLMHHIPQSAVFMWGNRHIIEFNRIHHTCLEGEDTGAIGGGAIDWVSWQGVIIRNNFISDTMGYGYDTRLGRWRSPYFTHAIYPDWAASGVTITGNILVRAGMGGINLHGGRDNLVENNVIVDHPESQLDCTGWTTATGFWSTKQQEWIENYETAAQHDAWKDMPAFKDPRTVPLANGQVMYGNIFRRNIVSFQEPNAALWRFRNLPLARNTSAYNLVWHHGSPLRTGQKAVDAETGDNLLPNPGLEEGVPGEFPAKWQGAFCSDGNNRIAITGEMVHSGVNALLVEPASLQPGELPAKVYFGFASLPFKPGGAYCLRVWMKARGKEAAAELEAYSWKKDTHHWSRAELFLLTDEWQEYSLAFRLPGPGEPDYKETMDTLGIRLTFSTGGAAFYADTLSLREATLLDEWDSWRAQGQDGHSIVADPLFIDPGNDDYRLASESPAFALGFKEIPMDEIGPYADPMRATWPL